jgi:hypothetical protein
MNESEKLNQGLTKYVGETLHPMGWIESFRTGLPVDTDKQPLPWWTYPAIDFMATLVKPDFRVFEYGGGHSTLWWSARVAKVITVDHDRAWVDKISPSLKAPHEMRFIGAGQPDSETARLLAAAYFQTLPRNTFPYEDARITVRGLNDTDYVAYAGSIHEYDHKFDCIVIDGMARRLCAHFAADKLEDNGVILFDNSNRSDYMEGYQFLIEQGFFQLRLWGSVAGATFPSCTSVFIRSLDALPRITYQSSVFGFPEY